MGTIESVRVYSRFKMFLTKLASGENLILLEVKFGLNFPHCVGEIVWIIKGFECLVEKMKIEITSGDNQLRFTYTSLKLKSKEPGYVAFRKIVDVSSDILWIIFGSLIQINGETGTISSNNFEVKCTRLSLGFK